MLFNHRLLDLPCLHLHMFPLSLHLIGVNYQKGMAQLQWARYLKIVLFYVYFLGKDWVENLFLSIIS